MPITVNCPGCRQTFGLPDTMRGRWIACPNCGMGFAAVTDQPAPQPAPNAYPGSPPPVRHPTFEPPVYDDDDEPIRPRSPTMPLVVALMAALAVGVVVLLVVALNRSDDQPRASVQPAAAKPQAPLAQNADREARSARIAGTFAGWLLFWIVLAIVYLVALVLMLAWVAKDSRARGVDGGAVWVIVILFTGWVGLLVYLASRPHGVLVPCATCNNRRLQVSRVCPHCGNA